MKSKRKAQPKVTRNQNSDVTENAETDVMESQTGVGARKIQQELEDYHSVSPVLAGGDVDADWQGAEDGGEETPGGHAPTPDQDEVDEIGRAYGVELPDNQELLTHDDLLGKRDAHRWELDRRSAEEHGEEVEI